MTKFGRKTMYRNKKKHFFFILPMVAISQRSIPKDQLYENNNNKKKKKKNKNKNTKKHCFVLNTTKISSFFLFLFHLL